MHDPMIQELRELVRRALGPDDGDRVLDLALPAVRLDSRLEPMGRSRLGGAPLLEPDQAWPRWGDRPLSFLAVLDVEDVAGVDLQLGLPARGLLNFFYEADEQLAWGIGPGEADGWRVVLADPDFALERQAPDGALEFTQCPVGQRRLVTLPRSDELVMRELLDRHGSRLDDVHEEWERRAGIREPHHQLGGWPYLIQNPIQMECQYAANGVYCGNADVYQDPAYEHLRRGATAWRLLLQIDSEDTPGWMWGDAGTLYYCLDTTRPSDAALATPWMIFQCS